MYIWVVCRSLQIVFEQKKVSLSPSIFEPFVLPMDTGYDSENQEWNQVSLGLLKEPGNFALWQQLIQTALRGSSISKKNKDSEELKLIRISYESLLSKYPRLFKYWEQYADFEFRLGRFDECELIYLKALKLNNYYSIELWIAYLKFKINSISNNLLEVLSVFETARSKIGYHYYSDEFYSLYLNFLSNYSKFDNDVHKFGEKYLILLRIVIEIPLYNYKIFQKEFLKFLSSEATFKQLSYFVPERDLNNLKKNNKNNLKLIVVKLKKLFTDVFITTQYKSYQLFKFEKFFVKNYWDPNNLPVNQLVQWDNYLTFIELNDFPKQLVMINYERCLIITSNFSKFWIRYANYFINNSQFLMAKSVLTRSLKFVSNSDKILIKLVNLDIYLGNHLSARDILIDLLKSSNKVPITIYEKLANVEYFISDNNQEHFLELLKQLIADTKNDFFFRVMTYYSIENQALIIDFLKSYLSNPLVKSSKAYWDCVIFFITKFNNFEVINEFEIASHKDFIINNLQLDEILLRKLHLIDTNDFNEIYSQSLQQYK